MSSFDPRSLEPHVIEFLTSRHLATLTTLRRDGSPHVVPVGFTYDPDTALARVITSGESVKARNADRMTLPAAICQVDGRRWLTVQGSIRVERGAAAVADAEERYAARYRVPRVNPLRVVLIMDVTRILGSVRPPA